MDFCTTMWFFDHIGCNFHQLLAYVFKFSQNCADLYKKIKNKPISQDFEQTNPLLPLFLKKCHFFRKSGKGKYRESDQVFF